MQPRDQARSPEYDVDQAAHRVAPGGAHDDAEDRADQQTAASTSLGQFDQAFGGGEPAVQRKADPAGAPTAQTAGIHQAAAAGVEGASAQLPYLDTIQRSFGRHDVGGVGAHTGDAAASSAQAIGARAYAVGDQVAFRGAPDLHTSAHEAAHVVQQRGGVSLKGGVDEGNDAHEQHADQVADLVVGGQSAEAALDAVPGGGGASGQAVQRDGEEAMVTRGGRSYLIQRGDNLSAIARRFYGHARYWRDIMRANPTEVHDEGNLIHTGHTLQLPLLQVAESSAPTVGLDDMGHDPSAPTTPAVCEPDAPLGPVDETVGRDYRAVFRDINNLVPKERDKILMEIRERGEWEQFLASLDETHVATVQSWNTPETGQGADFTLEERISAAHNSARGQAALAAVDSIASVDTNDPPRITERVREMLTLGVALPALEGNDLAAEGVLTVTSASRAAEALIAMPTSEYLRISMQLTLAGGPSEWLQQFNLLKAVAARRDQFLDADASNDSLANLETFADSIRDMSEEDLVRQTNVTQIDADLGLVQKYTMSCNVTSAVVVRASSDPVEALRMHQESELGITQLGGSVAAETEACLEAHGGNVAVARDTSSVTSDVNNAITALAATAPADELAAVSNYMQNLPFDAAKYAAGMILIRAQVGRGGEPNDQAMRIVRETAGGGAQPGLDPNELATQFNGTLGVTAVTGQTATVDWDDTLWNLYTADNNGDGNADRTIPTPVPAGWTTRISGLLDRARPQLEAGADLTFNVYWNGGGGHTMTFTNVRDDGGSFSYLVHDTWTGTTSWVSDANIMQCNWPGGGRGVLAGVIG